jgi:cobalt-zinc-cadmium resistance protein CzcA
LYTKEKEHIYKRLDSVYQNFATMAKRRFELGETNYLEKITAQSKQKQININLLKAQQDAKIAYSHLMKIIQSKDTLLVVATEPLTKLPLRLVDYKSIPETNYYENRTVLFKAKHNFEKQQLLPDISLNYFQGTNSGINTNLYGYQLGLKIPLLFGAQSSRIKASQIAKEIAEEEYRDFQISLNTRYQDLNSQLINHENALTYYEQEGTVLAQEILKTANGSFKNGEIDFYQYILSIENAYDIQLSHLENLNNYNQIVIKINYLTL